MIELALALLGGLGVHLVYTALVTDRSPRPTDPTSGPALSAPPGGSPRRRRRDDWLVQAGLHGVDRREFTAVVALVGVGGAAVGYVLFAGAASAAVLGLFAASLPVASYRLRRRRRLARAHETWPRLIEEIRVLTGAAGRSVPNALFDVGRRAPDELRIAFAAAEREWRVTTDFERTISVLKHRLADPTADVVCETLLVAHELGGTDLDRRLEALVIDRLDDVQGRKDALARQAGVRFARWFTIAVPIGMALVGMSIGDGRAAYSEPWGQILVAGALCCMVACWVWAGRIMALPEPERVLPGPAETER